MELHEEIRRARKDLGLSQDKLAQLCGIQRRQLSILERGGNVTINTLRKVIGFLPNLKDFTFEQVRMKPTYVDYPPFEWDRFYANMSSLQKTLEELNTAVKTWLANPPSKDVDPAVLEWLSTNMATDIVRSYARTIDPEGAERRREEAELQREEERLKREQQAPDEVEKLEEDVPPEE